MFDPTADSPLEAAAGAAGPHAVEAFRLLGNETRLAILLALWEAYDPHAPDNAVPFSELYARTGSHDSGNFTYHLEKLTDHYVEGTAEGYRLRNVGLKIVQTVIAGTGLEDLTLTPTEIDMSCYRCGAPVELSYEDEHLYHVCTECEGNSGPRFAEERPVGTLMMWDYKPAGLAGRTPEEVFVAGTIEALGDFGLLIRGICPECSGPVEATLHVCEAHEPAPGEACSSCGTPDEIRVRYSCTICKHGDLYPVQATVYDHPAVIAFCYEHGIETTFGLEDGKACGNLWAHLWERGYTLVSENPVRVRVQVPGDGETLRLILDQDLAVRDITRVPHGDDGPVPEDSSRSDRDRTSGSQPSTRGMGPSEDGVALPDNEEILAYLRCRRWPEGVACPYCGSTDTIKKGTTGKDAQQYRCHDCRQIFNDLTETVFADRHLTLPEMFYITRKMDTEPVSAIARRLDRSAAAVRTFVEEVQASQNGKSDATIWKPGHRSAPP